MYRRAIAQDLDPARSRSSLPWAAAAQRRVPEVAPATQFATLPDFASAALAQAEHVRFSRPIRSLVQGNGPVADGRVPELGTTGTVNCQHGLHTAAGRGWQAKAETVPPRGG
jgi:hypothetical protein